MTKFEKCLWIVEKLLSRNSLSLKEINDEWEKSPDNDGKEITPRTFNRDKNYIADCFGLDIEYSHITRSYSLSNMDAIKNNDLYHYLMGAFHVRAFNTLAVKHKEKIMLQDLPTGVDYLQLMLKAIDAKQTVVFDYHTYYKPDDLLHFEIIPCFLRMFENRWYLIGEYLDRSQTRVLALERMKNVSIGPTNRECSPQINPVDYYGDCFGIIRNDQKPVLIKLKVYNPQVKYIRSSPLHHSQDEIETADDYAVFSYYLRPSYDFLQKILWNRENIEVLAPKEVRDEMKSLIEKMLNRYL
jgi:predicted DNA-binding transcriptional regulator YafY